MEKIIATIGAANGLRGAVKVNIRTDRPESRLAPGTVVTTDNPAYPQLTITGRNTAAGKYLLRFGEVTDRTGAEALRGTNLLIDTATVPDPDDDGYYPHQLRGLDVIDEEGYDLGTVADLVLGPAQDLLVVTTPDGEVLVPFVYEIVPEVDLEEGVVVVAAPPGLFPEPTDENDADPDTAADAAADTAAGEVDTAAAGGEETR